MNGKSARKKNIELASQTQMQNKKWDALHLLIQMFIPLVFGIYTIKYFAILGFGLAVRKKSETGSFAQTNTSNEPKEEIERTATTEQRINSN